MQFWSFQDNGIINDNGGVYGPFSIKALGVLYIGAYNSAPPIVGNYVIRAHPWGKPTIPTVNASAQPNPYFDGIPLNSGSWFRLASAVDTWYFSVPSNGLGVVTTYGFFLITDECWLGMAMGFTTANID